MPNIQILEKPFLVFGKPNISDEEIQAVVDVMRSGWIGTGKVAKELEDAFVYHMGSGFGIAVSSCTIGLAIALKSLGICKGDDVITSPLTFSATVNAILMCGARPVFADVDESGCLDPGQIERRFTSKTMAILPVNYTGNSCDMKTIMNLARDLDVCVVEDSAHSFGGSYLGHKQGSFGDLSVFSFYATKNITSGEGGMIYTQNKHLAEKCRILSQNGQSSGAWGRYSSGPIQRYEIRYPGFKGNLPDILAAIGLAQFKRWKELKEKRDMVWSIYERAFGKKELGHSQHLYTIQIKNRDMFRERMHRLGIGTGVHYEALHLEPAYQYLNYKLGDFPVAEKIASHTVSLPVSNCMSVKDAKRVVEAVKQCKGDK